MELDMANIIEAAARTGTFLEVNASWLRLDLKDMHIRQALAAGATIVIDTDAHNTGELTQMRYGVTTARRGGARKQHVLNALPVAELRKRIKDKKSVPRP
jgi:DNA polymerase (family 10)